MHIRRGHRGARGGGHSHQSHPRRLILTVTCIICLGTAWIRFLTGNASLLPDSLGGFEIVRAINHVEGTCAARLRNAGIDFGFKGEGATVNPSTARRQLYHAMNASIAEGIQLGGGAIQGRDVEELFRISESGHLLPVLHPLHIPVRAIVIPVLDPGVAKILLDAVDRYISPLFPPNTLWMQNSELLHSTLYHASTHLDPVPASPLQLQTELLSILTVAEGLCAVHAVLDSIVVTRSGTVLALWQAAAGHKKSEPAELRRQFRKALPGASKKQVVTDTMLLHTTLARVATVKVTSNIQSNDNAGSMNQPHLEEKTRERSLDSEVVWAATAAITQSLCGLETIMDALWYVEEDDLLALALNGRMRRKTIPLQCRN